MSAGAAAVGSTITKRIKEAIKTAKRIAALPHEPRTKAILVRTAVAVKALHGCDAAPCAEVALSKLQSAMVAIFDSKSARISVAMMFEVIQGEDVDQKIQIISRRVVMLRRMPARNEDIKERTRNVHDMYKVLGYPGTCQWEEMLKNLEVAPLPAENGRKEWRAKAPSRGGNWTSPSCTSPNCGGCRW